MKQFPKEVKNLRRKLLLVQAQFAVVAGVSLSTIKFWEQGLSLPTLKNLHKLIQIAQSAGIENSLMEAYQNDKQQSEGGSGTLEQAIQKTVQPKQKHYYIGR